MKVRVSIIMWKYLRVQKRCGKYNRNEWKVVCREGATRGWHESSHLSSIKCMFFRTLLQLYDQKSTINHVEAV